MQKEVNAGLSEMSVEEMELVDGDSGEHFLQELLLTALQRLLQEKVVATGLHMD